jgi:hypothetical protein
VGCHEVGGAEGAALGVVFDDLGYGEVGVFMEGFEGCAFGF